VVPEQAADSNSTDPDATNFIDLNIVNSNPVLTFDDSRPSIATFATERLISCNAWQRVAGAESRISPGKLMRPAGLEPATLGLEER
jgi:hypothetical protein